MLLYITLTTLILALILFLNNFKKNKNAVFIALFFIVVSIYSITHYFLVFGKSPFWLAVFYYHFTPLYLLLGPLLLFYVRGTLSDNPKFSMIDSLHFIPALIQTIGIVPYLFLSFYDKIEFAEKMIYNTDAMLSIRFNMFFDPTVSFSIRALSLFLYEFYCGYLLFVKAPISSVGKEIPKKQFLLAYKWLIILILNLIIITICFFIITYQLTHKSPVYVLSNDKYLFSIIGVCFFIMTFSLLLFPNILYGMPRILKIIPPNKPSNSTNIAYSSNEEFIAEEDPFYELAEKIKDYITIEKPYLDPDFSLSRIAIEIQVPQSHVSYCINTLMNTRFCVLRSDLRIEFAIKLLQNNVNDIFTIEAIGEKSGFKTRSSFYTAFKEKTGITPTEFIKTQKIDS
jgi:AraC-like DNA-binding protein